MTDAPHPSDDPEQAETPEVVAPGLDLGGLTDALGGAGGLGGLLEQAQQMMAAQAEAAQQEVEGVAGGGAVRIRATGGGHILGVAITPEAVDPDDVPMLEDLVLAALHDVEARLAEVQQQAMGSLGDLFGSG